MKNKLKYVYLIKMHLDYDNTSCAIHNKSGKSITIKLLGNYIIIFLEYFQ